MHLNYFKGDTEGWKALRSAVLPTTFQVAIELLWNIGADGFAMYTDYRQLADNALDCRRRQGYAAAALEELSDLNLITWQIVPGPKTLIVYSQSLRSDNLELSSRSDVKTNAALMYPEACEALKNSLQSVSLRTLKPLTSSGKKDRLKRRTELQYSDSDKLQARGHPNRIANCPVSIRIGHSTENQDQQNQVVTELKDRNLNSNTNSLSLKGFDSTGREIDQEKLEQEFTAFKTGQKDWMNVSSKGLQDLIAFENKAKGQVTIEQVRQLIVTAAEVIGDAEMLARSKETAKKIFPLVGDIDSTRQILASILNRLEQDYKRTESRIPGSHVINALTKDLRALRA